VPEGRQVFRELSVIDNLRLGAFARPPADLDARVERILDRFPRLRERRHSKAGLLSGGEQQMLVLGRGLIADPKVLMLDEPSLGLAPALVELVFDALAAIRERGVTVLLVEQRAQRTVAFADRTYVLGNGELRMTMTPADADDTDRMIAAYLA